MHIKSAFGVVGVMHMHVICCIELEHHAPVCSGRDSPMAFQIAF